MMATGEPVSQIDDEVAEVIWLPADVARRRLQYPLEQALIEASQAPGNGLASSSRPSFSVRWFQSIKKRWRNFVRPISLQRLENTIQTFQPELDALIEERRQNTADRFERGWDKRSKQLLEAAKQALNEYDPERGWRCLRAADRFCFYGLSKEEVKNEARAILAEASDEEKGLTKWRKKSILDLLTDSTGKLKDPLNTGDVIRAKRILDEHQDNVYQKLAILRIRLRLLTIISVIALIVWLVVPPLAPSLTSLTAPATGTSADALNNPVPKRLFWFAVILSGVLGAIVSGFTSSFAKDQNKTRIPAELSTSTITFARLVLAMVSAVAISIFLVSGILNFPKPSYELLLAVALVSGFSDRLLLRQLNRCQNRHRRYSLAFGEYTLRVAMPRNRISVIGIRPKDEFIDTESFGPDGLHLRWSFPREKGFPSAGFKIYRRRSQKKGAKQQLSLNSLTDGHELSPGSTVDGVDFLFPDSTQITCRGNGQKYFSILPPSQALLELRFPEPVVGVRIEIAGVSGPATLRAYDKVQLVEQTSEGQGAREVVASAITRITIELSLERLLSIAYTTEAEECNDSNWENRVHLQLPVSTEEALKLLGHGLRNYYAQSLTEAISRYEPHVREMIDWLKRLQNPTEVDFHNPTQPPHLLQILNDDGRGISNVAYPQSILLLAALDPNIARMLCLYWVDVFKPDGEGDPQKGAAYDYKVQGFWNNGATLCGLLFNLGAVEARLPTLKPKLVGEQLPGQRWSGRNPLGRVGLKWPRPQPAIKTEARAVQPVLYDLVRIAEDNSRKWLTENQLVLVQNSAQQDTDDALFIDRDVPLDLNRYELRPIDLFGQVGEELTTEVMVEDTIAPPPPVRLRTLLNLEQTELQLQFEYGAMQHQQAPDIKEFKLYWQPNDLFARLPVTVEATHTDEGNQFRYTLRVRKTNGIPIPYDDGTPIPYDDLIKFTGDVVTNVLSSAGQPLPADQRQRYRIEKINPPDNVLLQPTSNVLSDRPDEPYELVGDPHNRAHWTQLTPTTVYWREPINGVIQTIQEGLPVEVRSLPTPRIPSPDPFASIPEDQRKSFPGLPLPPIPEMIEVEIDRHLLEADVFTGDLIRGALGGIARPLAGGDMNIFYAVPGTVSGVGARIGLPSGAAVSEGDVLTLIPQPEMKIKTRYLVISGTLDADRLGAPGGEIAFEETRDDGVEITHVARVISSAVNGAGTFGFLARFTTMNVADLLQPNMAVRYYAPYRIKLDVSLAAAADAPTKLPIPLDARTRSAYVAVSAKDELNNEGPLCTPAQFTVIRPRPSGKPTQPYPCQLDEDAEARDSIPGYATPPDRQGRATICLKWDAGNVRPSSGLRYEVARALDNGILAAHLRNWQMGRLEAAVEDPLVAGVSVVGNLLDAPSERGLYRATFTTDADVPDPSIFRKGRLANNGVYFEVTLAKRQDSHDIHSLVLLLRAAGQIAPASGSAELAAPPDYTALQNNKPRDEDEELTVVAALRRLATQNPEAFGMATGVPIAATEFTDEVAGLGRNRFFYRVRAADAAENRSEWSEVSAAFYQVDTTPPETPSASQVLGGERKTTICWLRSDDPHVTRYDIYRANDPNTLASLRMLSPAAHISVDGSSSKEVIYVDEPLPGLLNNEFYYYRLVAIKTVRTGSRAGDSREIPSKPSEIIKVNAFDTNPPIPPSWITASWWDVQRNVIADENTEQPVVLTEWTTDDVGAKCFVFHTAGGNNWVRVSDELTGILDEVTAKWRFRYVHVTAVPTRRHRYRLQLKNRLGIVNVEHVERIVPPFQG